MSFFTDLKDMHSLKQQAEAMQSQLAKEEIIGTSKNGNFTVKINGNQDVLEIRVPEYDLQKKSVEEGIKEAMIDAKSRLQDLMKSKMQGMLT